MIFEVNVIVRSSQARIFKAWTYTSQCTGTLQFRCGIEELYVGLFHEVFEVLYFFLECVILTKTLVHFELLLKGCSIMLLGFVS